MWAHAPIPEDFVKGSGILQFDPQKSTLFFGLVEIGDMPSAPVVSNAAFKYGVGVVEDQNSNDRFYAYIVDGQLTTTTVQSAHGDGPVKATLNEGQMIFFVLLNGQANETTIHKVAFDNPLTLIPLVEMDGSGNSPTGFSLTRNALTQSSNEGQFCKITVKFLTQGTRALFGFASNEMSSSNAAYSFTGDNPLVDTTPPPSLTVELPSLGSIQSYDGKSTRRQQIAAVIPSLTKNNMDLTYEAHFPIWIALDNASERLVSEIQCRLLDANTNKPITIESPGCSLTFLFKSPKE